MPETFFISSIEEKLPLYSRYSIIFLAIASPTPGNSSSSDTLAVFMLIFPLIEFVEFEENWLRECKGVKVIYLNRKALERIKDKMFCPNTIEIKEHKGLFGKIFG